MAARRSNKRKRRNRGRFGFLYQFLSLVIILVVVAAGCAVFFRVDQVTAVGGKRYTAEEIVAASGIEKGDNLLLLNRSRVVNQILTGLPYVDEVNPRRVLPDQVILTVTECTPAAVVKGGEGYWVVDAKGKLLEQLPSAKQAGVAVVTGITALLPSPGTKLQVDAEEKTKLQTLTQLLQALSARGMMEKVDSIDLTGTATCVLGYDGRFTVKLPLSADFPYKMRVLEGIVGPLQPNEKGAIDLTREDRFYFDPQ